MSYVVRIQLINEDTGTSFSDFEDPYLGDGTPGEIYRELRSEYGRCQSKLYLDTKTGTRHVGWYFVKRQRYDDADWRKPETYLRGCWATLYHETPRKLTPVNLGGGP